MKQPRWWCAAVLVGVGLVAAPALAADLLPLSKGIYVAEGMACRSAPLSQVVNYWGGASAIGSGGPECKITTVTKSGGVIVTKLASAAPAPAAAPVQPVARAIFANLSDDALLNIGAPADWIEDIQSWTEERFFQMSDRLPAEVAEALLDFAATGRAVPDDLRCARPLPI